MQKSVDNRVERDTRKIIGFDMDGVIIDHTQNKIAVARKFGIELVLHETPSDIMREKIETELRRKIQQAIYDDPDIALSPPLMDGAARGIEFVKKNKIQYFLISRRKNPAIAVELLQIHGLWPAYFDQSNTFFVLGPVEKNEKAQSMGITHYIDDELGVIDVLVDVPNKFLFDPHNALPNADHYSRISSWGELLPHLL